MLAWSYRALSPGAARLFRLFGAAPFASPGPVAAARLADVDEDAVAPLLDELGRAGLTAAGDAVRAYAAELAAATESEDERRAALYRLLTRYHLPRAVEAACLMTRDRPPAVGTARRNFAGRAEAAGWLSAERVNLRAAVAAGRAAGLHDVADRLSSALECVRWET